MLGWYDPDRTKTPAQKLRDAMTRYERKWHCRPVVALVSLADAPALADVTGIELRPRRPRAGQYVPCGRGRMSQSHTTAPRDRSGADIRINDSVVITVGTQFVHGRVADICCPDDAVATPYIIVEDKQGAVYTVLSADCSRTRSYVHREAAH